MDVKFFFWYKKLIKDHQTCMLKKCDVGRLDQLEN